MLRWEGGILFSDRPTSTEIRSTRAPHPSRPSPTSPASKPRAADATLRITLKLGAALPSNVANETLVIASNHLALGSGVPDLTKPLEFSLGNDSGKLCSGAVHRAFAREPGAACACRNERDSPRPKLVCGFARFAFAVGDFAFVARVRAPFRSRASGAVVARARHVCARRRRCSRRCVRRKCDRGRLSLFESELDDVRRSNVGASDRDPRVRDHRRRRRRRREARRRISPRTTSPRSSTSRSTASFTELQLRSDLLRSENVKYFALGRLSPSVIVMRTLTSAPAHLFFGAIWGYALGARLVSRRRRLPLFFAVAAIFAWRVRCVFVESERCVFRFAARARSSRRRSSFCSANHFGTAPFAKTPFRHRRSSDCDCRWDRGLAFLGSARGHARRCDRRRLRRNLFRSITPANRSSIFHRRARHAFALRIVGCWGDRNVAARSRRRRS